jgi:hypothetical protein
VDSYLVVKTIHIISATILFGTGLGIAHFHLRSSLAKDPVARLFGAGMTVSADFLFTLPAVIVQPLSGAWLIWKGGFDWWDYWLTLTYGLYGISAAQQTNRGLATTSAVLSYVGKPFTALRNGRMEHVHGWQDLHAERYPELGMRLFGNCDIPDLDLFPPRYPTLQTQRFSAGHELKILHIGTWLLSWMVRLRLVRSLDDHAVALLRLAFLFDAFGSGRSGFHMYLSGLGRDGRARTIRFFLIARSGHGPYIPCMPAILLARKLARDELCRRGALPCVDLIPLDEYMSALEGLDISIVRDGVDA